MKNLLEIENEIMALTFKIETDYPELYCFLDENPLTIPSKSHPDIDKEAIQNYLESLKQLLKHHLETHKKNN